MKREREKWKKGEIQERKEGEKEYWRVIDKRDAIQTKLTNKWIEIEGGRNREFQNGNKGNRSRG